MKLKRKTKRRNNEGDCLKRFLNFQGMRMCTISAFHCIDESGACTLRHAVSQSAKLHRKEAKKRIK